MGKQVEPYKCAFSLNNDILYSACSIAYKLGQLSTTNERRPGSLDYAQAVKSTLALEGIEVSPSQMRGLNRGEKIPSLPIADRLYSLYAKMGKVDPYDKTFLTEFEEALWSEGVPHRLSRRVSSFPYPIPMHAKIEPLLNGLYNFANAGKGKIHPLTLGCLFYFEILAIEPYSEYTGILARYLMKAFFASYSKHLLCVPIEKLMEAEKANLAKAYEEAVNAADTAPFVKAMIALLEKGIDSTLRKAVKGNGATSPLVEKLLAKMEDGRFYSAAELCALLGLKSRLGLQKNYLRPALEGKLLEMSNPLSPTDRSQRYRKK